ncbi:MAG: adenosylcobinamide-GDP ribazoletransferase [Thiomonas sp. 13-66-29]|jgi:adenosylcobinamide-GDP ribazoletransferase|nr:MAG: adenosylcobinamide-GDP ribazoletransferase [Thiomonas sp. 13-66-29]
MKVLRPLGIAVQFLTRLPVRLASAPTDAEMGQAVLFYPAVGIIVGAPLVLIGYAIAAGFIPHLLGAAMILAAWVMLTGGLHLDGLADSADAWAGGRGHRERALAIMKDPNCGPIGVVTLLLVLLLKFAAIADLLDAGRFWALLLPPVLGRIALPLLFYTTPYVRRGGLGEGMAVHLHRKAALMVLIASFIVVPAGWGFIGLGALLAAVVMFVAVRRLMMALIGGMTGDAAGAMVELVEAASLVALTIVGR